MASNKTVIMIIMNQMLVMKLFITSIAYKNPFFSILTFAKIGVDERTVPLCETVRTPTSSPILMGAFHSSP